jgi:hypothetical protein
MAEVRDAYQEALPSVVEVCNSADHTPVVGGAADHRPRQGLRKSGGGKQVAPVGGGEVEGLGKAAGAAVGEQDDGRRSRHLDWADEFQSRRWSDS